MPEMGRTTIAATATRLDAATTAESEETHITALATNTEPVWWGYDATVTTSLGIPIYPGETRLIRRRADAIWLISASGSQAVAWDCR